MRKILIAFLLTLTCGTAFSGASLQLSGCVTGRSILHNSYPEHQLQPKSRRGFASMVVPSKLYSEVKILRGGSQEAVVSISWLGGVTRSAISSLTNLPAPTLLLITIIFDLFATTSMKFAEENPMWLVGAYGGYITGFSFFSLVLRKMQLGVAYAIWCSTGMVMTTLLGRIFFGESLGFQKIVSILVICAGVAGLSLSGGGH